MRRSFKFLNVSFRNPDANHVYLTIIGNYPNRSFPNNFSHLIGLSNQVILADNGANGYLNFMRTHENAPAPAFITGDMDSIKKDTYNYFEGKGVPLIHDASQEVNDVEKALALTKKRIIDDYTENNRVRFWIMVWGLSGHRFDQLM